MAADSPLATGSSSDRDASSRDESAKQDARRKSSAQRRHEILHAAVDLFQRQGYLGTTMDEVATAAGITKRTLYRYVASKQLLLLDIHGIFIDEGLARWTAVAAAGGPPDERLRELIRTHLDIVAKHGAAIRVFFDEFKHLEGENRRHISAQRKAYERILYDTIEEGIQTGVFGQLDPHLTTLVLLGALTEVHRWYRPGGTMSIDELSEFFEGYALRGIRARTPATGEHTHARST